MKTTVPRSPRDSSRLGSIPTLVALLVGATVMLAMDVPARGDTTEVAWPRPQHCPEGTVTIQHRAYCPGYIVAVRFGAYGVGARIVVQGATVENVDGPRVRLAGGPACMPAPSTEWVTCGPGVPRLVVHLARDRASEPQVGAVLDVHGTTTATGLRPDGHRLARASGVVAGGEPRKAHVGHRTGRKLAVDPALMGPRVYCICGPRRDRALGG